MIRWHRRGFRLFWKWKSRTRGRLQYPPNIQKLIREMAPPLSGLRQYGHAQVSDCSAVWNWQRREQGVWPLGFIFCESLATTRGAALDPALHSQSLVPGHGPDPTRILVRLPCRSSHVFASVASRSSGDKSFVIIFGCFRHQLLLSRSRLRNSIESDVAE